MFCRDTWSLYNICRLFSCHAEDSAWFTLIYEILHINLNCIPEYRDYFQVKIGSFRIDKQLPNFLFLSAENRKAWAHIMPRDAYLFLRDLENPVRRCSLICMQKHRILPKKLSGAIHVHLK